jgi:acetoin utilization deacetylase AcuC-like enzyme
MKSIFYDENSIINLALFGIEIPALKSRKTKTLEALLKDKQLCETQNQWLITENPYSVNRKDLERIHTKQYVDSLFSEDLQQALFKAYELINPDGSFNRYNPQKAQAPLPELFDQVLKTASGTYFSAVKALETGFCYFLGGGLHHGHKDYGHGFCPTNDIMIAAARILFEKRAEKIWIIDVDAHKGDGTAEIAADFDSIKTLSVHMSEGWPLDEPEFNEQGVYNLAYCPSDIDIPIKKGEESLYNERLKKGLLELETLSGEKEKPDLAIVLLGVDPYEKDELPSTDSLQLSENQMLDRDKIIYNFLNDRHIPSAYTMAGGYGRDSWEAHYNFLNWVLKREIT